MPPENGVGAEAAPVKPAEVVPQQQGEPLENANTASKSVGGAGKLSAALALSHAKVKEYADDSRIYKTRIDTQSRFEFWKALAKNKKKKVPQKSFFSWDDRRRSMQVSNEMLDYALPRRILLKFSVNVFWDYCYLVWLLIWVLALIITHDKLAVRLNLPLQMFATLPPGTVHLPMLFMLLSQIPPCAGAFYFTHFCNDLAKCQARENFPFWAFNAVIIAQYIEFSFYGGQGCANRAGKCRNTKSEGFLSRMVLRLASLFEPRVAPEQTDDVRRSPEDMYDDDLDWDAQTLNSGSIVRDDEAKASYGGGGGGREEVVQDAAALEYIRKVREEKEAIANKAKLEAKRKQLLEDKKATEWLEWDCIVCSRKNRRPKFPKPIVTLSFGEKGVYYKRTVCTVKKGRPVPRCLHCYTYADYKPPLATAHLFPYNPNPHVAFENYPKYAAVQGGVKPGNLRRFLNIMYSFLFGIRNNATSKLNINDWRLKFFAADRFPEIPRQVLIVDKANKDLEAGESSAEEVGDPDPLEVGEIVECKLQKSEWSRCKIVNCRSMQMYDIKYDTGEELRFVKQSMLRLRPEKREYAYRLEICMVFLVISSPVAVLAAFFISPSVLCLGMFFISSQLLIAQAFNFGSQLYSYYSAGCLIIFRQMFVYFLPVFLFWLASSIGVIGSSAGVSWQAVGILFSIAKFSSLHVMYIMRPTFATMGAFLFTLSSAFLIFGGSLADGAPLFSFGDYAASICLGPGVFAVITLIVFRKWLGYIWDVSLKVRPLVRLNFDNRGFFRKLYDGIVEWWNS